MLYYIILNYITYIYIYIYIYIFIYIFIYILYIYIYIYIYICIYIYIYINCSSVLLTLKRETISMAGGGAIGGYPMATGCFLRTRQQIVSNFGIVS